MWSVLLDSDRWISYRTRVVERSEQYSRIATSPMRCSYCKFLETCLFLKVLVKYLSSSRTWTSCYFLLVRSKYVASTWKVWDAHAKIIEIDLLTLSWWTETSVKESVEREIAIEVRYIENGVNWKLPAVHIDWWFARWSFFSLEVPDFHSPYFIALDTWPATIHSMTQTINE